MRSRKAAASLFCFALTLAPFIGRTAELALPGYKFEFPRDYFARTEYETEWWYYTGNLRAEDGHSFGFELTFFRAANPKAASARDVSPVWRADQIYLAHFALSDITSRQFYHTERMNRAGPGLAGASVDRRRIWNGNWQVRWPSFDTNEQELEAVTDTVHLKLHLEPEKPLVINGRNGVSQKGPLPGEASHYFSFPRIAARGTLETQGHKYAVSGLTWMDREFFSSVPGEKPLSWDWLYVQLTNGEELMLYRLRDQSGAITPFSSGTFVDATGHSRFLSHSDFELQPRSYWRSPSSGRRYPLEWQIDVPSLRLNLHLETLLADQEMLSASKVTRDYWEGAVRFSGTEAGVNVAGEGYLELTGYEKQ
jgi:predicted secreted hydrolase